MMEEMAVIPRAGKKEDRSPDGMRNNEPLIGDISNHATLWWAKTVERTMEQYTKWLGASPLERLRLSPPRPVLDDVCGSATLTQRLEQRVATCYCQPFLKS